MLHFLEKTLEVVAIVLPTLFIVVLVAAVIFWLHITANGANPFR